MSSQPIRDFLTKQLSIDNNIVTFRSLSRHFSLDVHLAHNELAAFLQSDNGKGFAATYLVSGERKPLAYRFEADDAMDEEDMYEDDVEGEYAPQSACVLVAEADLERTQASFETVDSVLVYSLSPSLPRDAGLLCIPTTTVRETDTKKDADFGKTVGKIVSAQVVKSNKPLPTWGGRKAPPAPVAGPSKTTVKEEKKETKPEKSKPTGKLDFSKAKVKKEEEEKPIVVKAEPKTKPTISEKVQVKVEESKKRGTKRKSAIASDSEDDVEVVAKPKPKPAVKAQSSVRVHKGVVLSDDEDDDTPAPPPDRKGKSKAISQQDKDVRALMEIDDDAVERVSRKTTSEPPDSKGASADEDVEMSDVEEKVTKPAPKPRKPKKVVPVGKNGLKKRRVVKSKQSLDAKGYIVTEDYSEYESVDEEEEEPAPAKGKGKEKPKEKEKEKEKPKPKPAANPAPAKPKPKPSGPSKAAQSSKGIASFFTKK
uniref:DNA polymerase delta subunit 3 n=1 Tax=Mycena chlorophos TaxID=658473 RepID=A0ABQ0L6I2_MYCCL|nr:DNA polymerase subunit Cdc27 [Mycena chlorophos]